jgi:prepilin-type N-terminal cleavage/methylation domain-containing protein
MKRIYRTPGLSGGFSLIEVMIAVVVLATGLLALAALQASLSRSSAESKTRGRVAAMLSARMDELRGSGYDNAVLDPGSNTVTSTADGCDNDATDWIDCPRVQAALGSLTVTQTNTLWTSAVDAGSFTQVANRTGVTSGNPEFIRVTLQASWTGANANEGTHNLAMTSEFSALALRDALLPPPPGSNTSAGSPVVRTDNPSGPGVIPIAVGGGDATAASNPRPEVIGKQNNQSAVGTRFDVLTYNGLSGPAVIQRRVETTVIGCHCRYGAGGNNLPEIYRTAQWPAVWTGERYDIYTPTPITTPAPGAAANSGPDTGVDQSALCTECCRDHHDTATAGVAKFDPIRVVVAGQAHDHYNENGLGDLIVVPDTSSARYAESCRMIRVDGFWRTAADMNSKHFGLLETETIGSKPAASGAPSTAAVGRYETFVKDFLNGYKTTTPTNASATALFDEPARLLNSPASLSISRPTPKDERYLHGRGLYVDYLEDKARAKITALLADTSATGPCAGAKAADCILPYLPFTTINVTELAFWQPRKADDTDGSSVLTVATGSSLIYDPLLPTRGRTNALSNATGTADAVANMTLSNSGVAIASAVDPDDLNSATDRQVFVVSNGTGSGNGEKFAVVLGGAALVQVTDSNTTNDPAVAWGTSSSAGNCDATYKLNNPNKDLNPNNYACNTSGLLGISGTVTVANYYREYTATTAKSFTYSCTDPTAATPTTVTVTGNLFPPLFDNLRIASATIGATGGTIGAATNDGKKTESTTVSFATIPANGTVQIGFVKDATLEATIASCTAWRKRSSDPWQFNDVVWTKSWELP